MSRWYSKKDYPAFVVQDDKIRKYIKKKLYHAGISKIEIERAGGKIRLILHTARPGIVIGRKGVEIEKLRTDLHNAFQTEFSLEVNEIRPPPRPTPSWWPRMSPTSSSAASPSAAP